MSTMTITTSGKIHLRTGCELYKYNEKAQYKGERLSRISHTHPDARYELNGFNTTDGYKKLSYLPLWDKYNLQFIESKTKATRLVQATDLQENKLENSSTSPFSAIFDFFNNTIIQILILGVAIILIVLIMKTLLIKLLTEWKK